VGLCGRAADEIRKAFDVADILVLSPGAKPADRHVLDQSPAQRTDGLVGHWGLLSWVRLKAPQSQHRTPASRYSPDPLSRYQLPRERFSPMPLSRPSRRARERQRRWKAGVRNRQRPAA